MLALVAALALNAAPAAAETERRAPAPLPTVVATLHFDLTSPTGPPAVSWATLALDREHGEVFVVGEGFVRVFDGTGMEIHRFGDDGSLGEVMRVAPLDDGDIVVLTTLDGKRTVLRCDFRGDLQARFGFQGLPPTYADFEPDMMVHRNGKLYFAERARMRVVITDTQGKYETSLELADIIAAAMPRDGDAKPPSYMDGFGVDPSGNFLLTSSPLFAAFVVSPTKEVRLFGGRGSRVGRFNIIGGIDADENGFLYVTDRLRSIVSVWDPGLNNLGEFGYRGDGPTNLIAPFEIAVANGKVYVSQAKKRGVRVFRVELVQPAAPPVAPAPVVPAPRPARPNPYLPVPPPDVKSPVPVAGRVG